MRSVFARICASMVVAAGIFGATLAFSDTVAPGEEGELLKFLPPQPGKHICFARVYTADHLVQHPKQKVSEIEFRLAYYRFEPDEYFPQGQRNYYFEVLARLRGQNKLLKSFGECSSAGDRISCGVDCDGGGVVVERTAKPNHILLSLDEYGYLRMTGGCGGDEEGEGVNLEPGEDDHKFLLTEKSEPCPAYDDW